MKVLPDNTKTNPWYGTALATAVVGGAFAVIITGLIIFNYARSRIVEPKREEKLETLKIQLRMKGDDEQLISRIRQLDLKIRQDRIRSWDFNRKSGVLLLGSIAVLLIGVKCADTFKKKMPAPQLSGDKRDEQIYEAMRARWAVTAGLVILFSGALFLLTRQSVDFGQATIGGTFFPLDEEISKNWPRFRGPGGLGISAYTNIPTHFDGKTGEGILWKTPVPLAGNNSPVVWGDRIFLSGADESQREVYCFDARSGELLWKSSVANVSRVSNEPIEVMEDTGFAAPTVATDGQRVYAIFANGDVACFDYDGKKVWARNLGLPDSAYGYASSLAMYRNLLLVQFDQASVEDGKSKMIAIDGLSGQTVWQNNRPVGGSWTSLIVVKIGNQYQLITCGNPWVISYNPANGAELWRADCLAGDLAPSPVYASGYIFAVEPYNKLVAIRPDGKGDVTETHIAWSINDGTPDICSPVSNGELIFLQTSTGILNCYKVSDGTKLWEEDLKEEFTASPSLVGKYLYLPSDDGVLFIIEAADKYKEVARCELSEKCYASPAFMDGRIYIRGLENLYCIGNGN